MALRIPHSPGTFCHLIWSAANQLRLDLEERGDPTGRCPIIEEVFNALPGARRSTTKMIFSTWVSAHGLHNEMKERRRRLVMSGQIDGKGGVRPLAKITPDILRRMLARAVLDEPLPPAAADEPARCTARPTLPGPFTIFAAERGSTRRSAR